MRKQTYIIVGMLLGANLIALTLYRPSAPVVVGVGFLGYTNGVSGERFARFGLTNHSGITIRRWGPVNLEVKKSRPCTFANGPRVLLSPGQAEVILVPLHAKPAFIFQGDWRAIFYWRRQDLQTRFYDFWEASSPWLPNSFQVHGIPTQAAPSQWIDQ
jgi:hypothetical protein